MKDEDFEMHEWQMCEEHRTTFSSLYSYPDVPVSVRDVVEGANVAAVACVDAGMWMDAVNPSAAPTSKDTVRSLHRNEKGVVAFEFREMVPNPAHRVRRIYNLFLTLSDPLGVSADEIRKAYLLYKNEVGTFVRAKGFRS